MTVVENVLQKLAALPPGSQQEALDFVEFLACKSEQRPPLFDPEGLWTGQGSDVSPEDIAAARHAMWGKYDREDARCVLLSSTPIPSSGI